MTLRWLPPCALVACAQEYAVAPQLRVDVYPQVRVNAVDLLLVVDDSCSMLEEQENLAASFAQLIDALEQGEADWRVAVTTTEASLERWRGRLAGGTDEVVLTDPLGAELDRVDYDDLVWPIAAGEPLAACALDAAANDDPLTWQVAAGSPGEPNPCAGRSQAPEPVPGTPRPPDPGEVVIAELFPDPDCPWVELANVTGDPLDLGGHVLRDDGRDELVIPDEIVLAPGGHLVVGEACAQPDVAGELFLAWGQRWVDRDTPHPERVFADLVSVGTGGLGLEMGLEQAYLALHTAFRAENGPFLRREADLALLFVSDEDDMSHEPVAHYVAELRAVKDAEREHERVRFGVVAGIDPPIDGLESCVSELGAAAWAQRYVALVELTDGFSRSICRDFGGIARDLGATLSGLLVAFELSGVPDPDTLVVELYDAPDADGLVRVLEPDVDYGLEERVDEQGRSAVWLVFPEAPPAGHQVVASYELLPSSAELDP